MVLSDGDIRVLLDKGTLGIEPFSDELLQPASVDFTLSDTFSVIDMRRGGLIRPEHEVPYKLIKASKYVLYPGEFVLASTREYFRLPDDLTAFVEGRSSWGRLGLFVQNAGWVDPGFEGNITLELFNASHVAIELHAGLRLGQLVFARMPHAAIHPYRGKYQGQKEATGSMAYLDAKEDALDLAVANEAYQEYLDSGRVSHPVEELWKEVDASKS